MRSTPLGVLLLRCLRGRCPVCSRGPLFESLLTLRGHCPDCGYRYQRAVEYGAGGFVSGAMTINLVLTGAVVAVAVIYIAATGLRVPVWLQLAVGIAWTIVFPIAFHRVAIGLWVAMDLWLNPPLEHELAAAPPRQPPD